MKKITSIISLFLVSSLASLLAEEIKNGDANFEVGDVAVQLVPEVKADKTLSFDLNFASESFNISLDKDYSKIRIIASKSSSYVVVKKKEGEEFKDFADTYSLAQHNILNLTDVPAGEYQVSVSGGASLSVDTDSGSITSKLQPSYYMESYNLTANMPVSNFEIIESNSSAVMELLKKGTSDNFSKVASSLDEAPENSIKFDELVAGVYQLNIGVVLEKPEVQELNLSSLVKPKMVINSPVSQSLDEVQLKLLDAGEDYYFTVENSYKTVTLTADKDESYIVVKKDDDGNLTALADTYSSTPHNSLVLKDVKAGKYVVSCSNRSKLYVESNDTTPSKDLTPNLWKVFYLERFSLVVPDFLNGANFEFLKTDSRSTLTLLKKEGDGFKEVGQSDENGKISIESMETGEYVLSAGIWAEDGFEKFTVNNIAGWNLVSIPIAKKLKKEDYKTNFFEGSVFYTFKDGNYVKDPEIISYGEGFWVLSKKAENVEFVGNGYTPDLRSEVVSSGWSLLGTGTTLSTIQEQTDFHFLTFENGNWIENPDQIEAGKGFWLFKKK